jgi:3-dehydroquinate dehydratase-2
MHGVNLDQLGKRNPLLYGTFTLEELERHVERRAEQLGFDTESFHTNHEGQFIEHLHSLRGRVDAVLVNPGSWGHYAWSIRDALEIAEVPAVEIHISDVERREQWRRFSVLGELCFAKVSGRGIDGYDEALALIRERLASGGGS